MLVLLSAVLEDEYKDLINIKEAKLEIIPVRKVRVLLGLVPLSDLKIIVHQDFMKSDSKLSTN